MSRAPSALLHIAMSNRRRRERPPEWPAWFVPKGYPHLDQPLRTPEQVRHIVEDPSEVARRAFLPFIRFVKVARKFKRDVGKFVKKHRELKYAGHTDSQILRHYANLLNARYEDAVRRDGISDCVLAYRRMEPPKCNIHFANEAFQWIEANSPCVAQAFDVRDFFESLGHRRLKGQWKELLGVPKLPPDHYNVFKSITKYSWVDRAQLFSRFGITKKMLKSFHEPICSPLAFRLAVRCDPPSFEKRLIEQYEPTKGVPQGSPISALLSNMFMLPIDRQMADLARTVGALYRRYSDDILIVSKPEHCDELHRALTEAMKDADLQLHDGPGKYCVSKFELNADGRLRCVKPLQYLGFSYDGEYVRIRSHTLARFFRRMRKAVRREQYIAERESTSTEVKAPRRKRLYRRFTHLGKRNFVTGYSADARRIIPNNAIRAQLKGHWKELHAALVVEP